MDAETYLNTRVKQQIEWMEGKSKMNQQWYKLLKLVELLAAAAIPFLAGFYKTVSFFPLLTGILGVVIVIAHGLQQLYHFHENWITYRTTIESLKREKYLYESGADPYQIQNAFGLFVQHVEDLLAHENKKWNNNWVEKPVTQAKP